ncbi:MAG: hypothetical protein U0Q16_16090 [Bryobacteraceae bacterium]
MTWQRGLELKVCMRRIGRATLLATVLGSVFSGMFLLAQGNGQGNAKEPIPDHTLPLVITPDGFRPTSATITHGRAFFAVFNRTALPDVTLQLDKLNPGNAPAQKIKETPLPKNKKAWREVIDVTPGTYQITVRESPSWTFSLTVVPK